MNDYIPIEAFVRACYRRLLMREPDEAGLREHARQLADGLTSVDDVLGAFVASPEFQQIAAARQGSAGAPARKGLTNDHSQFGEFGILLKHWVNEGARHRFIVDVGARGRERSNSFDFLASFGWRALLIEANPALVAEIEREFAGLDYELVNVAVSDWDGRAEFHIGVNDDVSSLTAEAALGWGEVSRKIEVEVRRLGPLLRERAVPVDFDLLSLDIEGEDIKVLNDLVESTAYRPRWIVIEASYDFKTKSLDDLATSATVRSDYAIAGQTSANLILKYTAAPAFST